jgi:aminopeptidase N
VGAPGEATLHDAYAPVSGNGGYNVEHYDIDVTYKMGTGRLSGTTAIQAVALDELSRFTLDLVGLRATKVAINGERIKSFSQSATKLTVTPPRELGTAESFEVSIEYAGAPKPRGTHWGTVGWEDLDDGVLVASQPTGAPTWFPCNDHPSDKATFDIRVATDRLYSVVANGVLQSTRLDGGLKIWHYRQSEPTATYLAAICIGKLELQQTVRHGVDVTYAYPKAIEKRVFADLGVTEEMLAFFSEIFGPYPFENYTVVVTPDDLEIPLEAQNLAIFGANHMDGKGVEERLVAHELAHQWFGNSVGLSRWQDIWLNEGFGCYAEWLWSEANGGPTTDALARRFHASLSRLPQDIILGDPGPTLMFDDRVYKRGALTLHALHHRLGSVVFFDLVRDWTSTFRHSTAGTREFRETAAKHSPSNLDRFFEAWLEKPLLPNLP